jgi:hypothetical protein
MVSNLITLEIVAVVIEVAVIFLWLLAGCPPRRQLMLLGILIPR